MTRTTVTDHHRDCFIEYAARRLVTIEVATPADLEWFLSAPCTCLQPPEEQLNEAVWVVVLALLVVAAGVVVWMVV